MLRKRFIPEQIISKFPDAEVVLGPGKTRIEVFRPLNLGERTYYRW